MPIDYDDPIDVERWRADARCGVCGDPTGDCECDRLVCDCGADLTQYEVDHDLACGECRHDAELEARIERQEARGDR